MTNYKVGVDNGRPYVRPENSPRLIRFYCGHWEEFGEEISRSAAQEICGEEAVETAEILYQSYSELNNV